MGHKLDGYTVIQGLRFRVSACLEGSGDLVSRSRMGISRVVMWLLAVAPIPRDCPLHTDFVPGIPPRSNSGSGACRGFPKKTRGLFGTFHNKACCILG